MAAQDNKDSLDVLQDMFNEAVRLHEIFYFSRDIDTDMLQLIQTGKALRASRLDGSGQTLGSVQFKLPDTLTNYHNALDKIDKEIVSFSANLKKPLLINPDSRKGDSWT